MTSTAGRAATTSSYSITMRLHTAPDHGVVGAVATAISEVGGIVTGIDVAESSHERLVVDVTCSAADAEHAERLQEAAGAVPGVTVHKTSDRVFLLHIGGKIEVGSKVPLRNRDDLCEAQAQHLDRLLQANQGLQAAYVLKSSFRPSGIHPRTSLTCAGAWPLGATSPRPAACPRCADSPRRSSSTASVSATTPVSRSRPLGSKPAMSPSA